jgi:hypothetical protein
MREINIPIPNITDNEQVAIEVVLDKKNIKLFFRLEPVALDINQIDMELINKNLGSVYRVEKLKKVIENYDKSWELIQIFAPLEKTGNIHILYRKK